MGPRVHWALPVDSWRTRGDIQLLLRHSRCGLALAVFADSCFPALTRKSRLEADTLRGNGYFHYLWLGFVIYAISYPFSFYRSQYHLKISVPCSCLHSGQVCSFPFSRERLPCVSERSSPESSVSVIPKVSAGWFQDFCDGHDPPSPAAWPRNSSAAQRLTHL